MDFRQQYIIKNKMKLEENSDQLTDWEKEFYQSIKSKTKLTTTQFNKLQEIAQRFLNA